MARYKNGMISTGNWADTPTRILIVRPAMEPGRFSVHEISVKLNVWYIGYLNARDVTNE